MRLTIFLICAVVAIMCYQVSAQKKDEKNSENAAGKADAAKNGGGASKKGDGKKADAAGKKNEKKKNDEKKDAAKKDEGKKTGAKKEAGGKKDEKKKDPAVKEDGRKVAKKNEAVGDKKKSDAPAKKNDPKKDDKKKENDAKKDDKKKENAAQKKNDKEDKKADKKRNNAKKDKDGKEDDSPLKRIGNDKKTDAEKRKERAERRKKAGKEANKVYHNCFCDNVVGKADFDATKWAGQFFVRRQQTAYSFYPLTGECAYVNITAIDDKTLSMKSFSKFHVNTIQSETKLKYLGKGVFNWEIGNLTVGNSSVPVNTTLKLAVIDVDYKNYTILYICGQYNIGGVLPKMGSKDEVVVPPSTFVLLSRSTDTKFRMKNFNATITEKYDCYYNMHTKTEHDEDTCKSK